MSKTVTLLILYLLQLVLPVELVDVNLQAGSDYIIQNDAYPEYYHQKADLEWTINSPQNTSLYITCRLELPQTDRCTSDYISIKLRFRLEKKFCGNTKISTDTGKNYMKIAFHAEGNTPGGAYHCQIKAIKTNFELTPNCECGWKYVDKSRIVGGTATKFNEFASMAYLWDARLKYLPGGATIIADTYALTAAHVVKHEKDLILIVGDYNITNDGEAPYYARYDIERFIVHPKYSPHTSRFDIAIIQTKKPIAYSRYVGPACLPFRFPSKLFTSEKVVALGWGFTHTNGQYSDVLRKVELRVLGLSACTKYYDPPIVSSEMCTSSANWKDTCDGDSGGPILWENPINQLLYLVGIIESGNACGTGIPSVSTRVTSFLPWILSNVDDAKFCVK